jgi:hypothetical protein
MSVGITLMHHSVPPAQELDTVSGGVSPGSHARRTPLPVHWNTALRPLPLPPLAAGPQQASATQLQRRLLLILQRQQAPGAAAAHGRGGTWISLPRRLRTTGTSRAGQGVTKQHPAAVEVPHPDQIEVHLCASTSEGGDAGSQGCKRVHQTHVTADVLPPPVSSRAPGQQLVEYIQCSTHAHECVRLSAIRAT